MGVDLVVIDCPRCNELMMIPREEVSEDVNEMDCPYCNMHWEVDREGNNIEGGW